MKTIRKTVTASSTHSITCQPCSSDSKLISVSSRALCFWITASPPVPTSMVSEEVVLYTISSIIDVTAKMPQEIHMDHFKQLMFEQVFHLLQQLLLGGPSS